MKEKVKQEDGIMKKLEERFDEIQQINENREKLIHKFKSIKGQNERFKLFMNAFRENEKEFSSKLKGIKMSDINI